MRRYKLLSLLLCALLLAGCNDLVQTNPNEPTVDVFWQTEEEAIQGINAAYNVLSNFNGTYRLWTFFVWDQRSDLSRSESPWIDLANVSKFMYNSYDFDTNAQTWNDHYNGVFRANQVIHNVPDVEDMNPDLRDRIVAEAKFLRALMYFNLVNLYGDIPIVADIPSPEERPEQRPADEVWAQVETDLQEARTVLPASYPAADEGRATWGAATALLAKAHMQQREWSEAASYFEEVVASNNYDLLPDYAGNFDAANENSVESVFEIQFTDDSRLGSGVNGDARAQHTGPPVLNYGDAQPTQWFFDQFFEEQTVGGEDDPRIDVTFFYPGGPAMYGQRYSEVYTDGRTAPYWKKYTEYYKDDQAIDSEINKIVIRYAGVLLLYAEALNETGDQITAARYIQEVRDRVNLPDREAEFAAMSQAELREQIEHEQLLELGGENERILYLLRHNLFSEELDTLRAHDPEFSTYQEGRELLPIPQSEVDLNPNMEQSPGW